MALQGARQEIPGLDRGKPATSTIDWFDEGKRLFTVAAPAWIIFSALYSHEYWRRFEITPYLFGSLAELLPGSVFFAAITIGSVALIWLIDVVILGRKEMDAIDGATERVVLAFFFVSLIFPVVVSSAAIDLSDAVKMSVYAGGMAVTRYAMRFNALIRIFPTYSYRLIAVVALQVSPTLAVVAADSEAQEIIRGKKFLYVRGTSLPVEMRASEKETFVYLGKIGNRMVFRQSGKTANMFVAESSVPVLVFQRFPK